ncbi:hypothetical protein [Methylosinus sp. LW4]|nr:hypothetical protein [Methylosinus sp. LW4]
MLASISRSTLSLGFLYVPDGAAFQRDRHIHADDETLAARDGHVADEAAA